MPGSNTCSKSAGMTFRGCRASSPGATAEAGQLQIHQRLPSLYSPGAGWVDFDPTNGIVGNRDLIRVAVARDPRQAMPLTGTWYGSAEASLGMSVEVIVRRADERGTEPNS
jgi:transglutaminase-like putative cysteine protease